MNDTHVRVRQLLEEAITLLQDNERQTHQTPAPNGDDADLTQLTGSIGRPEYKEVKGYPLFSAGLGVRRIDGQTEWLNVVCWRKAASWARDNVYRGDLVSVVGRWQTEEWADKETGEARTKNVFVIVRFERVDAAA